MGQVAVGLHGETDDGGLATLGLQCALPVDWVTAGTLGQATGAVGTVGAGAAPYTARCARGYALTRLVFEQAGGALVGVTPTCTWVAPN
jgi:hypothetical protein